MSLLWKILLSTSIAITLLFALIGWIVQDQFVRIASSTVDEEVRNSFHAYESLWKAQAEQLASVSLVLSRMPDVRAAFSTGDTATIRDTAGELWQHISRSGMLLVVTDPRGKVISSLGAPGAFDSQNLSSVVLASAQFPSQAEGFIEQNGQLFEVVATPVYVDSGGGSALINVLIAGAPVDTELAKKLKRATGGSDFVFSANGHVAASTLAGAAEEGYSQFRTPLRDIAGREIGELRILRSADAARGRIAVLRARIVFLWVAAVLLGLALTVVSAGRLLHPVKELDAAAAQIAAGNYDVEVTPRSSDEIGRLAHTFNSMCASIRATREELIRNEQLSTISRLSTSIVHDLRNPLASIYGGAEMLVDDDLSSVQVRRLGQNIYQASRRMQVMLEELADVRRGHALPRESCRLRDIVEAALATVRDSTHGPSIAVTVDVPDSIELPLDRSPMERVFQNLFGNAFEAMPNGGSLRVEAKQESRAVMVSVEDSGPGIPPAIAKRLFRPFVTEGKKNGMGLGLALSRETVLHHGGDLWTDPAARAGARFLMRLPLADEANAGLP